MSGTFLLRHGVYVDSVISVDSLTTFRRHLKHYLFQKSYPDVILWLLYCDTLSGPSSG